MSTDIDIIQYNSQISQCKSLARQSSSNKMFRQFALQLKRHSFVKTLAKTEDQSQQSILQNRNTIKPKSFLKLINWMLKLSSHTLDFSVETFQISIKILRSYLQKCITMPSQLQMLGCICLHMASKVNQKTIIAIESYMECCMNIFTKKQFEEKEIKVYCELGYQLPTFTRHAAFYLLQSEIVGKRNVPSLQVTVIMAFLKQSVLQLAFLEIDPLTFVCNLYSEMSCNPEFDINSGDFLDLLKARKIQY